MAVFILEDALSVQKDNASAPSLYLRRIIRLDELAEGNFYLHYNIAALNDTLCKIFKPKLLLNFSFCNAESGVPYKRKTSFKNC